ERRKASERQLKPDERDERVPHARLRVGVDDILKIGLDGEPRSDLGNVGQLENYLGTVGLLPNRPLLLSVRIPVVTGRDGELEDVLVATWNGPAQTGSAGRVQHEAVDSRISAADFSKHAPGSAAAAIQDGLRDQIRPCVTLVPHGQSIRPCAAEVIELG